MSFSKSVIDLLQALEKAKQRVPLSKEDMEALTKFELDFPLHLLELEFGQDKAMSERLSIRRNMFLPEPELDDAEIKAVVNKILEVWALYNYHADFPHGLCLRKAYRLLLKVWDEKVMSCITGSFHFDFYDEELEKYVDPKADPETTYQAAEPIDRKDLPF